MDIKAKKTDLCDALALTSSVISAKGTLPILSNLLIQTDKPNGQIVISGTDLEMGIRTKCPATILEEGTTTAPAKKLNDIVRELPDGEVDLTVGKNNAISIKSKKAFFRIGGLDAADFPIQPEPTPNKSIELEQKTLKDCLTLTSFAASRDEARYMINGVLIILKKDIIRFVATDGKRLAMVEKKIDNAGGIDLEAIIPTKATNELLRILKDEGKVLIACSQNQVLFQMGNTTLVSRLIEGKFPDYERVIPKDQKTIATIGRQDFLSAIKRISLLTSQENQSIKLDFTKGKILVSSRSPNLGEAKEELDADINGGDLAIGFNPGYLTDALKNIDGEAISITMTDPDKPGLIKQNSDYLYVVMPMQLTH